MKRKETKEKKENKEEKRTYGIEIKKRNARDKRKKGDASNDGDKMK